MVDREWTPGPRYPGSSGGVDVGWEPIDGDGEGGEGRGPGVYVISSRQDLGRRIISYSSFLVVSGRHMGYYGPNPTGRPDTDVDTEQGKIGHSHVLSEAEVDGHTCRAGYCRIDEDDLTDKCSRWELEELREDTLAGKGSVVKAMEGI